MYLILPYNEIFGRWENYNQEVVGHGLVPMEQDVSRSIIQLTDGLQIQLPTWSRGWYIDHPHTLTLHKEEI